ncbi:MATE family efflux transporter [Floccifex sp.]|uniref:MATE family efflux transporter n=1 Tax=Floccifex sp. TaxID=2815810 RepID=UPI003EFC9850
MNKYKSEVKKSFLFNFGICLCLTFLFMILCLGFSTSLMKFYIKDIDTIHVASQYLRIISFTFLPLVFVTLSSVFLRCIEKAKLPLYASIFSALLNTTLNYFFIFKMSWSVSGAAFASVLSQWINAIFLFICLKKEALFKMKIQSFAFDFKQYISMLIPVLMCETLWALGENVYAAIYGHISIQASAAMTLTNPIQGLMIGALCGLSQAASILIGKELGMKGYDRAYWISKKLLQYGMIGSILLSFVIFFTRNVYVQIYQVDALTKSFTTQILVAYALIAPVKVENMILGSGILRSGGKTKYVMFIDLIGTWGFGVPFGYLAGFIFHLSIPFVYFILSLEEIIRFLLSLFVFKQKKWMNTLKTFRN